MSNPIMNFIFISVVSRRKSRLEPNQTLNQVLLTDNKRGNRYLQSGTADYYIFTCFILCLCALKYFKSFKHLLVFKIFLI